MAFLIPIHFCHQNAARLWPLIAALFKISRSVRVLTLLLSALLFQPALLFAEPARSAGEYQIKAVFLYNFTKFVEWPATAFASNDAPLVIAVLGDDPFGPVLDEAIRNEVVRHHPLKVVRIRRGEPVPDCQILFICRSEKDRLEPILKQVHGKPVLTVADFAQAAERGASINLVVTDRVKMEINPAAVAAAHLEISSKLLNIARTVSPAGADSSTAAP
jgi:hypothetical protein